MLFFFLLFLCRSHLAVLPPPPFHLLSEGEAGSSDGRHLFISAHSSYVAMCGNIALLRAVCTEGRQNARTCLALFGRGRGCCSPGHISLQMQQNDVRQMMTNPEALRAIMQIQQGMSQLQNTAPGLLRCVCGGGGV